MPGLFGVEKVVAIYVVFTLVLTAIFFSDMMENGFLVSVVGGRVAIAIITALLIMLYKRYPCHATYQLRIVFQIALLSYWYPDIYHFSSFMPSVDHWLAAADQAICGCQPALAFRETFSGVVWNELFNLGYFSYFPMIAALVILVIVKRPRRFDRVTFILMCSFFMFYLVFVFVNAAGPQFYYYSPGVDAANAVFPDAGNYFLSHHELRPMEVQGPFSWLIKVLHGSEEPIAAFPSSHVGVSTIVILLAARLKKVWALVMLPFYVLLVCSTVYIQAHYFVDVLGGFVAAIVFMIISNKLYTTHLFHRPKGFDDLHRFGHHHKHHHHRHHHH